MPESDASEQPLDLVIEGGVLVDGALDAVPATIGVRDGRIAAIVAPSVPLPASRRIDATGKVVFPGFIDPHVHYHYGYGYRPNERDYESETASALIGGVTTVLRMHRAMPPYPEHVPQEVQLIREQARMAVGLHLTIQTEEQLDSFEEISDELGISSFKLYMAYRGRAGALQSINGSDDGMLFAAMQRIAAFGGVACVHAENSEVGLRLGDGLRAAGRNDLRAWEESRPSWTEAEAISRAGFMAEAAGVRLYVVHVSTPAGVEAVERVKERGVPTYAEVSIQYLTTSWETPLGSLGKVTPPLRSPADVEEMWAAVARGAVDTIGTDHVAHTRAKARPEVWDVMPGFPGTATMVPALLTYGYHRGRLTLQQLARLASQHAADIFGLTGKGHLAPGADADLVLVDLEERRRVAASWLLSSSDYSLYEGEELQGWPTTVIRKGKVVMEGDQVLAQPGQGEYLRHPRSRPA